METENLFVVFLISLVAIASGCSQQEASPEIGADVSQVSLTGNESRALDIWIKNNYNDPASFSLSISSSELVDVRLAETGNNVGTVNLGTAEAHDSTERKTLLLTANTESLGNSTTETSLDMEVVSDALRPGEVSVRDVNITISP